MIATILTGSSRFHAIDYNEKKVNEGVATLLEMHNIPEIQNFGNYTPAELRNFFIEYSERNDRITKAQFHLAISCKGHEYTPAQLKDFAHEYLDRMGYNNEGQPWVIYAHHDTENTHIHIVTSRVAPDGHKIDHNHERRRSQRVLDEIMSVDRQSVLEKDIKLALTYHLKDIGQWGAVMSALGYDTKENKSNGLMSIFRGGVLMKELPTFHIERDIIMNKQQLANSQSYAKVRSKRKSQLQQVFKKYHDKATSLDDFASEMKRMFGVDLVYYGSKDTPYGYAVVDHQSLSVYSGKEIMPIMQLRNFPVMSSRKESALLIIKTTLSANPYATSSDLNRALSKKMFGVWVKKNTVCFSNSQENIPLPDDAMSQLRHNNKLVHAASFNPQNADEVVAVAVAFRHNPEELKDFIAHHKKNPTNSAGGAVRSDVVTCAVNKATSKKNLVQLLGKDRISLLWVNDKCYFVDKHSRGVQLADSIHRGISNKIASMPNETPSISHGGGGGFHRKPESAITPSVSMPHVNQQDGITSTSREWEVGQNNNYDDLDNQMKLCGI